jgi:hypothetical protein
MAEDYKVEAVLDLKTSNARTNAKQAALVFDDLGKKVEWLGREFLKSSGKTKKLGRALGTGNARMRQFGQTTQRTSAAFDRFAKNTDKAAKSAKKVGSAGVPSLDRAGSAVSRLGAKIRSAGLFSGHLLTKLLAIGGALLTMRALTNAARNFVTESVRMNSEMEDMLTSLATLRASIDGMSFSAALSGSRSLQRQLNIIAAQSPATGTQLTGIFTAVYGPMRRAGTGMQDLLDFTQQAASVGRVLGVDYQQLSRDVSMMATGVAGTDVKTFRLLRSMGLITQETQEWNRMALADPTRAAGELRRAFRELGGPAAAAFGRTWTGASSTFQGLIEHFTRIFTGPAFTKLVSRMRQINAFLLRYREKLEALLRYAGARIAAPFDRLMIRMSGMFRYVISNLDNITARIDRGIASLRGMLPTLRRMAATMAAFMVVARVLGPLIAAVGALGSMISGLSGIGGMLGVGGGAAAGGAAAGAGAAVAWPLLIGAIVAIAGAFATLIVVAAQVAAVWAAVGRYGSKFRALFEPMLPTFRKFGATVLALADVIWTALLPIFEWLGTIIISVIHTGFKMLESALTTFVIPALNWLIPVVRHVGSIIKVVFDGMAAQVIAGMETFDGMFGQFRRLATFLSSFIPISISFPAAPSGGPGGGPVSGFLSTLRREFLRGTAEGGIPGGETPTTGRPGAGRGGTNIDMRNARITVHQDLRGEDPDRIMVAMTDDVARQAVQRSTTPFSPALTH